MRALKDKVNIVAYDSLGCGESDKPSDDKEYTTDALTEDAAEIFKRYATANNVLVGHSYGGPQAVRLMRRIEAERSEDKGGDAATQKEIKGIVLLGAADFIPDGGHPIFTLPICLLELLHGQLTSNFADLAFSPHSDPRLKEEFLQMSSRNKMYVCRAFYQHFKWANEEDWDYLARRDSIPVLICQGLDDKITTVDSARRLYEKLSLIRFGESCTTSKDRENPSDPNKRCVRMRVVMTAGHQLMQEQPAEIASHIKVFLHSGCGLDV
jgi:pimeloyl-ACP methyl ester carboxylesterase